MSYWTSDDEDEALLSDAQLLGGSAVSGALSLLHPLRPTAASAGHATKPASPALLAGAAVPRPDAGAVSFPQRKPSAAAPPLPPPRKAAKLAPAATPRTAAVPRAPAAPVAMGGVLAGCLVHMSEGLVEPSRRAFFKDKLGALGAAFSDAPAAHVTHFLVDRLLPTRARHASWLLAAPHAAVVYCTWAGQCLKTRARVSENGFRLQQPGPPPAAPAAAADAAAANVSAAGKRPVHLPRYKNPPNKRAWTRNALSDATAPRDEGTDDDEDAAAGAAAAADEDDDHADEDLIAAGMEAEAAAAAGVTASEDDEVLLPRPPTAAGYACQPSRDGVPPKPDTNKNKLLCEVFDGLVELYSVSQARPCVAVACFAQMTQTNVSADTRWRAICVGATQRERDKFRAFAFKKARSATWRDVTQSQRCTFESLRCFALFAFCFPSLP
jgi:hypothetical protein